MFSRQKFSITLWAMFCTSLLFAATVAAQAQKTTVETVRSGATVSTSQLTGEVVQVEGNDLAVKLATGEFRVFRVPETRKFIIDGNELSVHDLKPGTTLTATVKTITTPLTVRTKSSLTGRVWYAAGNSVILTLPDGQNKQFVIKHDDNIQFIVNGRRATVFELRKGMTVSAEKIVEEPDVEIATDTTVVGHAPVPAMRASTPAPQPAAPKATAPVAPEPAAPKATAPATPEPVAPKATAPATPEPAAPETAAPAAPEPAAPETAAPAAPEPAAPETGGGGMSTLLWIGLIILLIIIVVIVARMMRKKK